ncbi:hypothetical protein [uncultured Kordia sp.]|uniref:hypothetical protein n=1 Tax=uncultured Kordia sp. TaxID=507699 RepID=UPI00261344A6|nr:hypothetical protein [uncultured Kordia sp.]
MKTKLLHLLLFTFFTISNYSQTYTSIPDSNFESALEDLGYDNIPNDGQVLTATIETIIDLDISNQNISDLTGIEAFRDLQNLNINDNSITDLDLTGISNLFAFQAKNNGLSILDVSTHSNLNQLQLDDNNLNMLDLSNNGSLMELSLQDNTFTSIHLSNNSQLQTLNLTNNNLLSIDVTNNTMLSQVFLNNNMLTELDVSNLSNLTTLEAENNMLSILNLKNGNNTNIASLNIDNNPDLFCILVDDVIFAESNFSNGNPNLYFTETSCYTAIPDVNFETALENLGYDDIPNDGQVPTGLIFQISDLNIMNASIQDLTGIEDFVALMNLTVDGNSITQLDLTNNTFLQNLEAQNCSIQTIDITGLSNLSQLLLANNTLTSLDLSTVSALNVIDLSSNNLDNLNLKNGNNSAISELDLRSNPNLQCVQIDDLNLLNNSNVIFDSQTNFTTETYCNYTAIPDANFESALNVLGYDDTPGDSQVPTVLISGVTSLDVMNASITDLSGIEDFESLTTLQITNNNINTLDLSNNAQLQTLLAIDCNIQNLNLDGLTNLTQLTLQFNSLTSLDLSTNTAISSMNISSNDLTYLNLQNGNNSVITLLDIRFNSNLECVLVDDLNVLTTATVYNDSQTNFTTTNYCDYTAIPDSNFEATLETLGYDDISGDGQVPTDLIETLTTLNVSSKNISDLTGIEDFVALTELNVSNNNLTTVSLTTLTNLGILDAEANASLTSLDVSGNTQLEQLIVEDCASLTTLNLSTNIILEDLIANQTNLSSITFGNLTNLSSIDFSGSNLTSLDVSALTALTSLDVRGNQLISLNIANGNNTNFTSFDARDNANLKCIAVDDPTFATANFANIDGQTTFRQTSCYTAIPDANFEAALTALDYDDIPNDGQVPTQLIEGVTSLDVNSLSIADLTGIEDFAALTFLNANNNLLTSLDVTAVITLETLLVSTNNLTSIDLSTLTQLTRFQGRLNLYTSLDFSNNALLDNLNVDTNANLSSINISQNPLIDRLDISECAFTSLDISDLTNLTYIDMANNNISSIDFTNNTVLEKVYVSNNPLGSIDVSNLTSLTNFFAINAQLTSLNVRNGNNTNFNDFNATNNPNLTCILVDDATYSTTNWTNIDATASFTSTDYCRYTTIPDLNFETALESLGYDDISGDGQVPTALIDNITSLNIQNQSISDITGIEDFTALGSLRFTNNLITTINLSNLTNLTFLWCNQNQLTALDLSNNTALTFVNASENLISNFNGAGLNQMNNLLLWSNQLSSIDVSDMTALTNLDIFGNLLTSLDISNNTLVEEINIRNNSITALDLSNNAALRIVDVRENSLVNFNLRNGNNTNITSFTATSNPNLTCIQVDDAAYSTTNWTDIDAQTNFTETEYCRYTTIPDAFFEGTLEYLGYDDISGDGQVPTELIEGIVNLSMINMGIADLTGIQDFAALEDLNVAGNFISTLDLSANTNLIKVNCQANGITTINLNGLTALQEFDGGFNSYEILDVSTNISLTKLHCNNTEVMTLDMSQLIALTDLDCSASLLTALNVRNGNNTNFTSFDATNNSNLTCILVDDAAYSIANWTNIDATASFTSTDYCDYTVIPDSNFEAVLGFLGYDDIFGDSQVPTEVIENVTTLDISNSGITDLTGIEDFTMLENLNIRDNNVATIDISQNTALKSFNAVSNNLTAIDITNNPLIEDIRVEVNSITNIDLSNQPNLLILQIDRNNLNAIDLSANTLLSRCRLYSNNLTSLDLSNNPSLIEITVQGNDLNYLNMQSGGNTNVTNFNAAGNANLTCILVDDAAYSTTNWTSIDTQTNFIETQYCEYTSIPDTNFEAALEALGYDDISGDGQVPTDLIQGVTSLDVRESNISSLVGIEDFIALENLNINGNNINQVDLSNNTQLTSLKAIRNNMTALDITNNPLIEDLRVEINLITSIDLSNQTNLRILQIDRNNLTTLDLTANTMLSRCRVDINNITSLDLSNNPLLNEINVQNNNLTYLNVQSGGNTNVTNFNAEDNTNLTCILVDDATYSTTNWTSIDVQTSFSDTNCPVDFSIAIDVYLQGAALNPNTGEENLMRDDLRVAGYLPTTSPYADAITCEATVFNVTGNDAIVDWVWIELRDATNNTTVSHARSALLQRDGDVVAVDGVSPLDFFTLEDTYYVVVHHRSHLGIMTGTAMTFITGSTNTVNLKNFNNSVLFGSNPQTDFGMPVEIYGMWCGNANSDSVVQYSGTSPDTPAILSEVLNDSGNFLNFPTYSVTGYNANDANMDGIIQYSGTNPDTPFILQNVLAHPGNFLNFSTYEIIEQLPENLIQQ